ncbi:ECF transporter S component [Candidatus Bathyarchaeota archaeon]|nr:ECF transporter S component [Candidatus Bathyarchaeota archaeon]
MRKLKITSREAAYISVMAASIYVATSIAVPMPRPLGIWHFGDVITFITGILFGPIVALLASAIGPTLFDVWNPLHGSSYIVYAPATLVIRGFMGWILGSLRGVFRGKPRSSEILAMVAAVTEKNIGYFLYDYYLYGPVAYLDLVTFFPMDALYIILTVPLLTALRRLLGRMYIVPPHWTVT